MKIVKSKIVKLKVMELDGLDPISLYLEDYEKGQGKITIECYGKTWSSYWNAMGDRTIAQFFCSCDNGYLAKNLAGGLSSEVVDYDKVEKQVKQLIDDGFDCDDFNVSIEDHASLRSFGDRNPELMVELYGEEWFLGSTIPMEPNGKYVYLCRIIDATRAALEEARLWGTHV